MRALSPFVAVIAIFYTLSSSTVAAEATANSPRCSPSLVRQIPERGATAPGGAEFVRQLHGLSDDAREAAILQQLNAGNIPGFLRKLQAVTLHGRLPDGRQIGVTVCVSPDYVAIGSDQDFVFVPMRLKTALSIANELGFALPTRKIVDAIYAQAPVHLQPQPLAASDAMRSTAYYWRHNGLILEQRAALGAPLGELTAGDKKDLVLTNRLWGNLARVAIYGWHRPDGKAIQPLSTVHGARYADYSHGLRLISATAYVDGAAMPLLEVLQDARLAPLLSDEGVVRHAGELVDILASRPAEISATVRAQ